MGGVETRFTMAFFELSREGSRKKGIGKAAAATSERTSSAFPGPRAKPKSGWSNGDTIGYTSCWGRDRPSSLVLPTPQVAYVTRAASYRR